MNVQIKRQLKIELDQADITTAVGNFLADNGYKISDEDLARINFVKSPKDGLRAELNINEATEVADEPVATEEAAVIDNVEAQPVATTVPEESEPVEDEAPGQVEPSTVNDVVDPAVAIATNEAIARALAEQEPAADSQAAVEAAEADALAARNSLFK